uniref:Uncharacterized protein n=1 Tax=Anopheles atroparvus TaxID=41427 RepID=A0AAG5CTW8_ANOAO
MEFYRPLLRLFGWCMLIQLTTSLPFTFPEGSSGGSGSGVRSRTSDVAQSRRQEIFEGRSIRGNGASNVNHQFPDIYSRYQVQEHENDPPGIRPTAGPFLTNRPAVITPPPQYTTRSDRPNAAYNRLPPSKNDEPIQAEPAGDDYDDDEDEEDVGEEGAQPDKPVPVSAAISRPPGVAGLGGGGSSTFNNLFFSGNDKFGGLGALFGSDNSGRHKFKYKRRKPGQPCIPYSLFHKLKYGRDLQGNAVDPKTLLPNLNLILADLNYYSPNNNYGGGGADNHDTGGAVFNNHFYDAVGGYPCQGVSFGGGG